MNMTNTNPTSVAQQTAPAQPANQQNNNITVEQALNTLYGATRGSPYPAEHHEGFKRIAEALLETFNRQGQDILSRDRLIADLQGELNQLKNPVVTPAEVVEKKPRKRRTKEEIAEEKKMIESITAEVVKAQENKAEDSSTPASATDETKADDTLF